MTVNVVVLNFYGNNSANYTHSGAGGTVTCPNGIMARLSTELPDQIRTSITIASGNMVIFQKVEDDVVDGMLTIGNTVIRMVFGKKSSRIIISDKCYKDNYRQNGNTKSIDMFERDDASGTYVYDKESASFLLFNVDEHGASARKYSCYVKEIPLQDKGELFDASIETSDIVFADFTTGDAAIEMWINATVSVAGLKMTWSSDTNTDFQETNTPIKLGNVENTGSFDNDEVKYSGSRCIVSKKIEPDSRHGIAIRYKIIADLINNGYDDIEIHDMNLLTQMKLYEVGGDDA